MEGISLCIESDHQWDDAYFLQLEDMCVDQQTQPLRTGWISLNSLDTVYMCWVWGLRVISFRERGSLWASATLLVYKNPGELFSRPWMGEASMFSSDPINTWRHILCSIEGDWARLSWLEELLVSGMAEAETVCIFLRSLPLPRRISPIFTGHT